MPAPLSGFLWDVAQDGYRWLPARPGGRRGRAAPEPFLVEVRLVHAAPARFRRYDPLTTRTGLFRDFADVWRSKAGVLKFADEHGPLGVAVPVRPAEGTPAVAATLIGEPLAAWARQITAMRRAVDLWDLYQKGDGESLAWYIRWTKDSTGGDRVSFQGGPVADERGQAHPDEEGDDGGEEIPVEHYEITGEIASPQSNAEWLAQFKPGDVFLPALVQIQRQVNEHLQALGPPALTYDVVQDRLVLRQVPRSLLQAMWLQFAEAVSGGKKHHQCRGCLRWFEITPRGMRSTRFHCSDACRVRAHRRRQDLARRLRAEGNSWSEIARELETDVPTVKQWLAGDRG
jgi:hypothetical protein